jgi:hypothetical protein
VKLWNIGEVRAIVDTSTAGKVTTPAGKVTLDLFSARAVVAVFDALSATNQERAESVVPLDKFIAFAFRHIKGA